VELPCVFYTPDENISNVDSLLNDVDLIKVNIKAFKEPSGGFYHLITDGESSTKKCGKIVNRVRLCFNKNSKSKLLLMRKKI